MISQNMLFHSLIQNLARIIRNCLIRVSQISVTPSSSWSEDLPLTPSFSWSKDLSLTPSFSWSKDLSLTPSFSWVEKQQGRVNRFNGFPRAIKTVETVPTPAGFIFTQLKQGVNERVFKKRQRVYEISRLGRRWLSAGLGCGIVMGSFQALSAPKDTVSVVTAAPTPQTPREFFNSGTRRIAEGKLTEAEADLETALRAQIESLQPPTLYNLGEVRYQQGIIALKKMAQGGASPAVGKAVLDQGSQAISQADQALIANELQQMVAAYVRGRGARKDLRTAKAAVEEALKTHGAVLSKWQRALGDFHGALEYNQKDEDARHNAEVVDRSIARLIDSIRKLQQMANQMGNQKQELGEKLKQLKGRIPAPNMPPGTGEEEEDEEETPNGIKPDQKEGPSREGKEMSLSPEQAGWLLDSFKLDSQRRLPMGFGNEGKPKDRNGPTW
jgi:tetratricopeptide (TPR) repeat protein